MSLYLLVSDLHLADRPPASCTESYRDDLLDLLRQTVKVARKRKVTAVAWAGDVFHLKPPSRTSHELVALVADIIKSYSCPVFVAPGNHDIRNDRVDSVDRQPLGMLYRAGAWRLEGWGGYDEKTEYAIYGVPWIQGYGNWAGGESQAADDAVAAALRGYREDSHYAGSGLVVAHAPLYPPGKELEWEHFPAHRWAEAMGGSGYVFYGHVHEPHGVYTVGGVTFCNNGALSRGSLHEYNLERQVGCTLWDSETCQFEFVPLDARPASEVFRLQEKEQATDMAGRLDAFLADVGHAQLDVLTPESVIAHARTVPGVGQAELALIEELLSFAEHGGKP